MIRYGRICIVYYRIPNLLGGLHPQPSRLQILSECVCGLEIWCGALGQILFVEATFVNGSPRRNVVENPNRFPRWDSLIYQAGGIFHRGRT